MRGRQIVVWCVTRVVTACCVLTGHDAYSIAMFENQLRLFNTPLWFCPSLLLLTHVDPVPLPFYFSFLICLVHPINVAVTRCPKYPFIVFSLQNRAHTRCFIPLFLYVELCRLLLVAFFDAFLWFIIIYPSQVHTKRSLYPVHTAI